MNAVPVVIAFLLTALVAVLAPHLRAQVFPFNPPMFYPQPVVIVPTTFDPDALNPGQSLSNGNLTTNYASAGSAAQTVDAYSSGLYYFEGTMTFSSSSNADGFGIMSYIWNRQASNGDLTLPAPAMVAPSGAITVEGNSEGTLGMLSTGVVVSVAVNLNVSPAKIWFAANGGNWNGSGTANPATDTGGFGLGDGDTFLAPILGYASSGHSGDTVTLNAGATPFSYAVPSGFTPGLPSNPGIWPSYPAFDPSTDHTSCTNVTYSNTNHTAAPVSDPGTYSDVALSYSPGRSAGKFMSEFTIGASWGSSHSVIGTFLQGYGACNFLGQTGSVAVRVSGAVYVNNSSVGTGNTYGAGNTVDLALDFDDGEVWYKVLPSGNWNNNALANPATNVGGFSLGGIICPCNPAVSMHYGTDSVTINNGDSAFTGTLPSGYTGFWDGPP